MRYPLLAAVVGSLVLSAVPAQAQNSPSDATITVPEVEVRSGPSKEYYATSKLRQGERVQIVPESKEHPGWLAIKPPTGSFSWINARFVQQRPDGRIATVISDVPAPVMPGSSLTNQAPNVEQVKVERGTLVVILDKPMYAPTGVWLPIQPTPKEVRYIPADAVKTTQVASAPGAQTVSSGPRPVAATIPGQPTSGTPQWQPGAAKPQNSTTTLYNTPPTANPLPLGSPPQWSVWGILRKTAFKKNGQDMFVLENRQGQPLLYVAAQPGFSLGRHVGQTVSLYGGISYWSDEYMRTYYMTATHIALP